MLTRVFVTGTDTAVGKTVVSRALLQALSQNGR
ncbi:TPA: AAA family ATPase, partial [Yersinia enterocolitica]